MYLYVREGIEGRRTGASNKHPADTIAYFLSAQGWLQEDLRITLMRSNPTYEAGQHAAGQGLVHLPRIKGDDDGK
jgi:hypothetical protein